MKREILFRGKRKDTGEWIYGWLIQHENLKYYILWYDSPTFRWKKNEIIEETIGQFTGLKDNNGVEIYDGDIITVNLKIVKQVRINDKFLSVQVSNKEDLKLSNFLDPWQTPGELWWNNFGREIIVIGNIHDNPELLK